jgi:phage I-like protein
MAKALTPPKVSLKCFKAAFAGTDADKLPSRLKIFDWGMNRTSEGDFLVDDGTLECFAQNQSKLGREEIAIDFNHSTVEGTAAFNASQGKGSIAGYGVPVVVRGSGIFLNKVETTPSGSETFKDYKDLSPAPLYDESTGRVLGLHSVALTPTGAVYNLTLDSAAQKALSAQIKTLTVPDSQLQLGNKKNIPTAYRGEADSNDNNSMNEEHMKFIKKALDMPEDCTYEDVMEKLKAHFEKTGGDVKKGGPLISPYPGTEIMEATLAAMEKMMGAKLTTLQSSFDAMKLELDAKTKQAEEQERKGIIDEAGRQGKVIPLSADSLKTIAIPMLKEIIGSLKKDVVPKQSKVATLSAGQKLPSVQYRGGQYSPVKTLSDSARAIEEQIMSTHGEGALKMNRSN